MNPLWHLGNTTDVRLLIPGKPEALRDDADDLDAAAVRLDAVSEDARTGTETPSWGGWARDQWDHRRSELLTVPATVAEIYRGAAGALRGHADTLAWAQAGAATAVDLWAHGVDRSRAAGVLWTTAPPAAGDPVTDPGAAHRHAATLVLDRCQRVAAQSGEALAALLDELSAGMPDGQLHGNQFFAGVAAWAAGLADMLWRLHLVRAAVDHDGWLGDLRSEWDATAGVFRLVTDDPLHAGPVLANTEGLRDNPGRWWGTLAPDLALSAAGGVASGSRVLTGVRRLDELPRVPREWPEHPALNTWEYSLGWDPDAKLFRLSEYQTATRLIDQYGLRLERAPHGSHVDWLDDAGTTYDAMGNFDGVYLHRERQWSNLFDQLDRHIAKADIVPIDVSQFSAEQIATIRWYVQPFADRIYFVGEQ
ncbi:putative T7SS-secreted protein [Cellulomonas fimi]|uniref:Putative T7SS secretion signal domain-containing protein n=1 Tax=Cellulomonas fimi (strain ATCC 484 / DSM 20113 / JCM 1341 / CCUG 24087 / LMG 16345 / NBRC 15513 / NCIMB 8980 / NCTC 7547 / NRS-133) TaxID=590998 RepID=F4H587_CELFA|nr:hypothetical protein [Cellulomonas fimi]AEE46693.1 hypothetical protein Celf_2568 [Cellulomonas fimi ATCC 484]NNH07662.1 hypothetical protein [Cellulomonas fimi]VEH33903.1 Uncharacterised protein [Cellulomonas fimi]